MRLHGMKAIAYAREHDLLLSKYNDPIEPKRDNISIEEAEAICREDDQLIYIDRAAE